MKPFHSLGYEETTQDYTVRKILSLSAGIIVIKIDKEPFEEDTIAQMNYLRETGGFYADDIPRDKWHFEKEGNNFFIKFDLKYLKDLISNKSDLNPDSKLRLRIIYRFI